ncbi:formin-binding protein, variant 2 [Entomophthora muscae]|nr:formin-binding protein, variant 2 [Entomophthora muscae]
MKELEQEYTRLSGELEEATRIWQHDWRVSCRLFQELEEERIEFIKKICWDFSNIIASVCLKDDESCERIRTALQNITVEHEIQSFIDERGTGYDPDYEMDGSPIYEIPALDSPLGTQGGSSFHISSPAMFIKKAFHRPHSFTSNGSLFGSGSASSVKNKAPPKQGSTMTSKTSHEEEEHPAPKVMYDQNYSNHSNPMLEGDSKASLTSFYDEVEAESKRIMGQRLPSSAKVDTDNNTFDSPSSLHRPDPPSPSPAAAPTAAAPTGRPLFFVRVIYDYLREMELEMSISAGQVVAVLATHDDGWWEGEFVDPTTGLSTRGIFPSNFTRKIE